MAEHISRWTLGTLVACLVVAVGCSSGGDEADSGADGAVDADADASEEGGVDAEADEDASADADVDVEEDSSPDGDVDSGPTPGEWQLPSGYFTPARMPMTLVHPRDGDTPGWVYAKNAHPGVRWEIPIVVQGGAWPFQYAIVNDGGATGLAVGSELARSEEEGSIVHRVTDDYGVLSWDVPVAGAYSIDLRVTDQEGSTLDVPISLTVGTDGWVFVDADHGDDSAGDGTIDAPFATVARVHGRDSESTDFANHRVYLAGTVPMDGNRPNGNLRIDPGMTPSVWVGQPGREAVLEAYEGKIVLSAPDFYFANLEHRHRSDFVQDDGTFIHMLTVWDADRYLIHDVTFSRFQGNPVNVDLGNSSVMMFTRRDPRFYVAVVNCTITGPSGVFTSAYTLRHAVFEKNRWVDADLTMADGSVHALIYIKSDNENITLRANEMVEGNSWTGLSGLGLNEARNIEFAYNVLETPYEDGRSGSIRLFVNSPASGFAWTTDTPVWVDRNSLRHRLSWEGGALADMPDGVVHIEGNVISPGAVPTHSRIVATDNLAEGDYLDDQMELTGAARADHLGRRGAEIAVPAP